MESNKEVISRLKFISRINGGEKINVRYMYVQQDDITTRISRTLYHKDNRNNALSFIKDTIDRSFEIIKTYKDSKQESKRVLCQHILSDIKEAKKGILNLKETYIEDVMFCCRIDVVIQDMEARILDNCNIIKVEQEKDTNTI
jgi:hypothetical protein